MTGGADRAVRYWEPSWPERSYIVAGPVWPDDTGIMDPASHKMQVCNLMMGPICGLKSVGNLGLAGRYV